MKASTVVGSFVLAVVVAGIAAPSVRAEGTPIADAGIPPTVWRLTGIVSATGDETAPTDPAAYTVQFLPDGTAHVRADCNQGRGTFDRDGSRLSITNIIATLVGCGPGSLGDLYLQRLQEVASFTYDREELVLALREDAGELRFAPSLQGVVWEWQAFEGRDGDRIVPDDPSLYTLIFEDGDRFRVRADCNRGSGDYQVDGAGVDLKVGPLTKALCPPDSRSEPFLAYLEAASDHEFRDGRLLLVLAEGAGTAEFAAVPITDEATPPAG